MKLHATNSKGLKIFTAYDEQHVCINYEKHAQNLILQPHMLIPGWSEATPGSLTESDMQKLAELGADVVLLGTGKRQQFPAPQLLRPLVQANIGLEVMNLQAACRTYNILAMEGRKVAAALLFDPE